MITVAIVEDEKDAADDLKNALKRYESEVDETIQIFEFPDAEKLLFDYKPVYDVIFFDIELPNINGMDAAMTLRKSDDKVALIFVTNMVKYALTGYKVGALDYFLKPVNYYELELRMEQLRIDNKNRIPSIQIPITGGVKTIDSSRIYYIEIMSHDMTYHTIDGDFKVYASGLSKLETQLANAGFARCSSSYLVNLKWCRGYSGDMLKVGNNTIKMSRRMKQSFITKLSQVFVKN